MTSSLTIRTANRFLFLSSGPFLTMLWQPSHSVCWPKPTSKLQIYSPSCKVPWVYTHESAELEITVSLLIQVDKLVQLLESPIFTCMPSRLLNWHNRFATAIIGTWKVSLSLQITLWTPYDLAPILCLYDSPQSTDLLKFSRCLSTAHASDQ